MGPLHDPIAYWLPLGKKILGRPDLNKVSTEPVLRGADWCRCQRCSCLWRSCCGFLGQGCSLPLAHPGPLARMYRAMKGRKELGPGVFPTLRKLPPAWECWEEGRPPSLFGTPCPSSWTSNGPCCLSLGSWWPVCTSPLKLLSWTMDGADQQSPGSVPQSMLGSRVLICSGGKGTGAPECSGGCGLASRDTRCPLK